MRIQALGVVWSIALHDGPWVATESGLWHRTVDGRWSQVLDGPTQRVVATPDGVYAVHAERLEWVGDDGARRSVEVPELRALAVLGDAVWVGGGRGVQELSSSGVPTLLRPVDARPVDALVVRDGAVWGAWSDELFEVGALRRPVVKLPGPARALYADVEGSLWVGTLGSGFVQVQELPYRVIDLPLAGAVLADPRGGVWLTRGCDAVERHLDDAVVEQVAYLDACPRALAWIDGQLWVGAGAGVGPVGEPPVWTVPSGYVLAIGPDGRWIGTSEGLYDRRTSERVATDRVPAVVAGNGDVRWAAGQGRVGRYTPDEGWAWREPSDGVASVQVRDLWVVDDVVWAGTYGAGLWRLDDDAFARVTTDHGLHENVVSQILVDDAGIAWLNGNRGVTRVAVRDLQAAADRDAAVAARLWRVGEGVGGVQPAGLLHDGEVWLPSLVGMTVFPVDRVPVNTVGPRTRLVSATVDGAPFARRMPPGPGRLEVRYTAGALSNPELVRFQVRLDQGSWEHLGSRRRAVWEGLGPGKHLVELRAANEDGVWGPPERLDFELLAPVHQRGWFRGLVLLGVLAVGGFVQSLRTRATEERNRQLADQVAQRERAEAALRQREEHYRRVFEGVGDGLMVVSRDGRIIDANPAAARLFRDARLVGRTVGARVGATNEGVTVCTRSDGTTFSASVSTLDDAVGGQLVSVTDVTGLLGIEAERRRLEAKVSQSQRLEAIGRLAGGVAHDFNNLLGGISGAAFALRDEVPGDEVERLVDDIDACVERGARLTRQLMAFGRQQLLEPRVVSVTTQLDTVRPLLLQALQGDVSLDVVVRGDAWIRVDPSQLDVALLNLTLNARAASRAGDTVRIEVSTDGAVGASADPWVDIAVVDEGAGMSEEVQARILEPFFTTRASGTGLGLPSVHGFVTQSGGELQVVSEEGVGTRICMRFPAAEPPEVPVAERAPVVPVVDGRGTVVVCDDDPFVLRGIQRVLKGGGYEVRATEDTAEALGWLEAGGGDLLVTDVRMPDMTGPELAKACHAVRPDLPVVFVSGFVDDEDSGDLVGPLVAKPFDPGELLATVARLLQD